MMPREDTDMSPKRQDLTEELGMNWSGLRGAGMDQKRMTADGTMVTGLLPSVCRKPHHRHLAASALIGCSAGVLEPRLAE